MDLENAKVVCEACFLGIASEGLEPAVNPHVQGVGLGHKIVRRMATAERSLQVYVRRKIHERLLKPEERIPDEVEGVPTDVIETGEFSIGRKYPPIYQRRLRPAMPGVSIGHYQVTAGTFGALVREGGESFILSNNHVLANANRAKAGDPILQPGKYDGGKPDHDVIGHLTEFVKVEKDATNAVDAAIAAPTVREDVAPEVLHIGRLKGDGEPELDMPVRKSGRTTRLTEGKVTATDVTLRVLYPEGGFLVFTDQFLVGGSGFGGPGDSGSLIVDAENRAVGLLFAGSPFTTVANRWSNVARALHVKPVG